MIFIPKPTQLTGEEIGKANPKPEAHLLRDVSYVAYDGTGTMIFEANKDIVTIVGRYGNRYVMCVTNHKGHPEELMVNVEDIKFI